MFHELLKEQRNKRNLTQAELARRVGIGRDLYNKYEKGGNRPSHEVLVALARELNVSTDYLLDNDVTNNKEVNLVPISPEERAVIEKLRKLDPAKREAIMTLLEGL